MDIPLPERRGEQAPFEHPSVALLGLPGAARLLVCDACEHSYTNRLSARCTHMPTRVLAAYTQAQTFALPKESPWQMRPSP
eukprot:2976664-Pleurochrysis_carterae.AAC.3